MAKYTEKEIIAKLPCGIKILEKPITIRQHYLFLCNECKHEWRTRLDHVLEGHGCPMCNHRSTKYSSEEVNEKIKSLNLILNGEYVENQTKVEFRCLKCDLVFEQRPLSIFLNNVGCPACRPKLNGAGKAWYVVNKDKALLNNKANKIRSRYGLTLAEYDELIKNAGEICPVCRCKYDKKRRKVIDHCHKTCKIRGVLCGICNSAIGLLNDDQKLLERAVKWLRKR